MLTTGMGEAASDYLGTLNLVLAGAVGRRRIRGAMARISVLGGTGYAGGAIVAEAVSPGHDVTSVSRNAPVQRLTGARYVLGSALDPGVLHDVLDGCDVVIEAVSPRGDMVGQVEGLLDRLVDLAGSQGFRLGVIGGASSLLVAEGGRRLFDVNDISPEVRPEIETRAGPARAVEGVTRVAGLVLRESARVVRGLGAGARHRLLPTQRRRPAAGRAG